jgi:hypothetical protein
MRWPVVRGVVPPLLGPYFDPTYHGLGTTANGAASWPTANQAMFFPLTIPARCRLTKLFWQNGGTVAGNVDVGLYDGEGNRLVSTGSVVQAGANAVQLVDITDVDVWPGLHYWAMAASSASAQFWFALANNASSPSAEYGVYVQASAFPLPALAVLSSAPGTLFGLPKTGALVFPRTVL